MAHPPKAREGGLLPAPTSKVLPTAVPQPEAPPVALFGQRLSRRFIGLGLTDEIPESRGQAARAADLGD